MLFEIIALFLVAASSQSQPDASSRQAGANDPDRVVCRAPQAATGSRLAQRRVCKTVAEWRAYEIDRDRLRRELRDMQSPRSGQ